MSIEDKKDYIEVIQEKIKTAFVRGVNLLIQTISEKIPIDETIKGLEFIEHERNLSKLKSYMDALMPFGEQTVVKYRNKFIQGLLKLKGSKLFIPLLYSLLIK